MKSKNQRLVYCIFVSLIAIPAIIVFSIIFVQNFNSYQSGTVEKNFVYEKSTPYSLSRFSNGVKIYAVDESGNTKKLYYEYSLSDDGVSGKLKTGDKITVTFYNSDYSDEATELNLLGIKTAHGVIFDADSTVKLTLKNSVLFAFLALFALVFEVLFLVFSKKIFKDKRITKRTDRQVSDDLWKESLFE